MSTATNHLVQINRQRARQERLDAESRIRVVMGTSTPSANMDEIMATCPKSKDVRYWRTLLCSNHAYLATEWTPVYQKAWENARQRGLEIWHKRNKDETITTESIGQPVVESDCDTAFYDAWAAELNQCSIQENEQVAANAEAANAQAANEEPANEKWVAQYDYTAVNADEVSFANCDLVIDVEVIDDGWVNGTVVKSGKRGMIPPNYLVKQSSTLGCALACAPRVAASAHASTSQPEFVEDEVVEVQIKKEPVEVIHISDSEEDELDRLGCLTAEFEYVKTQLRTRRAAAETKRAEAEAEIVRCTETLCKLGDLYIGEVAAISTSPPADHSKNKEFRELAAERGYVIYGNRTKKQRGLNPHKLRVFDGNSEQEKKNKMEYRIYLKMMDTKRRIESGTATLEQYDKLWNKIK